MATFGSQPSFSSVRFLLRLHSDLDSLSKATLAPSCLATVVGVVVGGVDGAVVGVFVGVVVGVVDGNVVEDVVVNVTCDL